HLSSSPHGRIVTQDLNNLFNLSLKGIAVGDFNAKHPAWSQGRSSIIGSIIHNHIANNNLVLLAPLDPTHFPYHHPFSSSTLDFGIMKNFSTGNATSMNDLSSDHNPVVFDINTNSNLSSGSKNINITNWKTFCELIHNSIPGNPKMDPEADIYEVFQQFTCCITSAINLSTRTKVISRPFRQPPKEISRKLKSKIDPENFTKLLSSHHTKIKPTNCKKKSKRTLKPMKIIDGHKQLWTSTPKTTPSTI
ncbi:hypothetical protein AVEN_204579-1, partial [Araneus ventricosus]